MLSIVQESFREGLKLDPKLTVSEWADRYRVLTRKASAEPGKWKTSRTPYLKEIMDCLSPDSGYEMVIFKKGTQIGATECGINWIGYCMHLTPAPMLAVEPTVDLVKKWSTQRLTPMIEKTPELKQRVSPSRERDSSNTVLMKEYGEDGILMMTGANSAVGLRGMPVKNLFLDEVDGYPYDVGGEGDPISLAEKRADTFPNRKKYIPSTPTIKNLSRIDALYEISDQRVYKIPCPFCKSMQMIRWANLVWKTEDPFTVRLKCEVCGELIEEGWKTWMLSLGRWIKNKPLSRIAGFFLSALYSPLGWKSWASCVQDFLNAKGNPLKLKTFVNTILAETWDEGETQVDHESLYGRKEEYKAEVPHGCLVLTGAADIQDDRIEAEIVGWGIGEESWSIDFRTFLGSPGQSEVWNNLDEYLKRRWKHESGIELNTICTVIDTGGHFTEEAYKFVKRKEMRRIFGAKGSPKPGMPIVGRPSLNNKYRIRLYPIGTDTAKEMIYNRLKLEEEGPGYMHFPNLIEYDEEYFKQLTSEKAMTKYVKGVPMGPKKWVKTRARNEALDLKVYGYAALLILNPNFKALAERMKGKIDELKGEEGPEDEEIIDPGRKKDTLGKWMKHAGRGWMRGYTNH